MRLLAVPQQRFLDPVGGRGGNVGDRRQLHSLFGHKRQGFHHRGEAREPFLSRISVELERRLIDLFFGHEMWFCRRHAISLNASAGINSVKEMSVSLVRQRSIGSNGPSCAASNMRRRTRISTARNAVIASSRVGDGPATSSKR